MDTIHIKQIQIYAYHGCLEEERLVGRDYLVDIYVEADLKHSSISDKLEDTVDYVKIYKIVKDEMAIPSNLLENVARRIINQVLNLPLVQKVTVSVHKVSPPIGGDVADVSVMMSKCV